jgi:RNA polymerase sigma-70 factor (ECF subfamily)
MQQSEQREEPAIGRARRGDRDAFRVLVDTHTRAVFRLAFRITGNQTDAEDMVQETFLKAWKQIAKFDGRASFATWIHRICSNCCLDHLRARKRKQDIDAVPEPVSHSPSPERLAQSSQITARLLPALDELSDQERIAFTMRHYEGVGIEEISAALGVAPGAAKHSVFRAVQKLRRALEPVASAAK